MLDSFAVRIVKHANFLRAHTGVAYKKLFKKTWTESLTIRMESYLTGVLNA